MANVTTELINKGVFNLVNDENIPREASSDQLGWVTTDDAIELVRGKYLFGNEQNYKSVFKQERFNATQSFGEENSGGKTYKLASSFTVGSSAVKCGGIILRKDTDSGINEGSVTISVQTSSGANPSGTSVLTKTYTKEQWANINRGFFIVEYDSEVDLSASTEYFIVIESSTDDTSNHPNLFIMDSSISGSFVFKKYNVTDGWFGATGELCFFVLARDNTSYGVTGYKISQTTVGTGVHFKKAGTSIQYLDSANSVWIPIIGGLDASKDIAFSNYTSLSGAFVFAGNTEGLWKFVTANPQSYIDLYDESVNFKGKITIDRSRMILWGRENDKTGLYGSKIDPQDSSVYTTVSAESIGSSGSVNYKGTLAFKAGGADRNCFAVVFTATYSGGTETFTDNYDGTLTGSAGGTGYINYVTGDYNITFANTTTGAVTADYQHETSNDGGLADFQKSGTRQAGEGFVIRQDIGGDEIMNVLIQGGKYYSIKKYNSYELEISSDDLTISNEPFRLDIGLPYWGAATNAQSGIIFLNTANPDKPVLTSLQTLSASNALEPIVIAPQFDFSDYVWDKCYMTTYNEYVLITGRTKNGVVNDRIFLYNPRLNSVDVLPYKTNVLDKFDGEVFGGASYAGSVYKLLNGFDDDGATIENYWDSKGDLLDTRVLKKVKRIQINGIISSSQSVEVYISYDNDSFQKIGTIVGTQKYVDETDIHSIGSSGIGESMIGGDYVVTAYPFVMEIKLTRSPKFRKRKLRFKAINIGYVSINKITDYDIWEYENKLPTKYRLKQDVSLDGLSTDQ